jgi:uncharacterized protein (DUF305 family)
MPLINQIRSHPEDLENVKITSVIGALASVVGIVALAGCATTSASNAPSAAGPSTAVAAPTSSEHNDADVAFVQGMIPHHTQAIEMAKLAAGRASNNDVKQLASRIEQAQDPEISQMRLFLTAWGMPESGSGGMDHSGMDGMSGMDGGTGMMSDDQMRQIGQAEGAEFDRMFLQMMTEHHEGAIEMSKAELADGQNADAKGLAQKITDAQQAEITEMKGLLTKV